MTAETDALAEVLAQTVSHLSYSVSESELNPGAIQTFRSEFTVPRGWQAKALADAVLASDWLAQRDRRVAEHAWDEGFDQGMTHRDIRNPYREARP